jgi:Holliday junction resolvase
VPARATAAAVNPSHAVDLAAEPVDATDTTNPSKRNGGGKASRTKGNRTERHLVHLLQAAGFAAERVPLSGAAGGSYCGDVSVPLLGVDRTVEVKCRALGFAQLYAWLEGADLLVVKRDRAEPLVVLPPRLAIEIATIAESNRASQLALQERASRCPDATCLKYERNSA